MKIIHLISSINRGGAENHLLNLALRQSEDKNKVKIIYFKGDGYWSKFYKKNKIEIFNYKLNNNFNIIKIIYLLIKLSYFLKKENPDVVHAHLALPEILITILRLFSKKNFKFIITKHLDSLIFEGSYGQDRLLNGLFFEKLIFKNADHIIFISKNVKNYFLKKIRKFSHKTSVIYYGIDKNYFRYNNKKNQNFNHLRKNKSEFIILNIARHIAQKEVDKLIDGFYHFLKIENNSKLILVGYGPETKFLKEKSKNLNISDKIVWITYTENIKNIFHISDLFCLTSKYEGLGLVLLESLLMKKPIVTVNRSAMREIIINNYNGISLKKNFLAKDLSDAFKKIKLSRSRRLKYKKNGLYLLKEKFNLRKMYNLTNKIYHKN